MHIVDKPWGRGRVVWTRDAVANDSDKSFTVPTGKIWALKFIEATIVTTATVGDRLLSVGITNGANYVFTGLNTASIAASKAATIFLVPAFGAVSTSGHRRLDNFGGSDVGNDFTLPELFLPAGYVIRIWDSAAIDAAADDLTIVLHYVEYDA